MMAPPLLISELLALQPGDSYVVYWAKDDDPSKVRCAYEHQTIERITQEEDEFTIWSTCGYTWTIRPRDDRDRNVSDTSRGDAKFFRHG